MTGSVVGHTPRGDVGRLRSFPRVATYLGAAEERSEVSTEWPAPDQHNAIGPLRIARRWCHERRWYASWSPASRVRLRRTRDNLQRELAGRLHRCCAHLKGHGGVKGTIRQLTRCAPAFPFVARFDRGPLFREHRPCAVTTTYVEKIRHYREIHGLPPGIDERRRPELLVF